MIKPAAFFALMLASLPVLAQEATVTGWQMQEAFRVQAPAASVASPAFHPEGWYRATVPGTVLTTLVDNKVYPDPLYGENMRAIPEDLNRQQYWYRAAFPVPRGDKGTRTWLHFAGVNYSADIWVNGRQVGTMRGAFIRGDFDVTGVVKPGAEAAVAVLVSPQPHPGVPHEHTVALGMGLNGGETAIDGPTFLSTIGWDWIPAIRDRDTGIWLPVTMSQTGPVVIENPFVTSDLSAPFQTADLHLTATLKNETDRDVSGTLQGVITGQGEPIPFDAKVKVSANGQQDVALDSRSTPALHVTNPKLWWPNGYGDPNLYALKLTFEADGKTSDTDSFHFGIRKIEYAVPDSENLTLTVNGVKVMARGGNWGMDDAMKRLSRERLDAQFHMHQVAHLNFIRNWVGQSTSPEFYEAADRYGILLWDEFFQPNPSDGPNPADIPTYLANVQDKVLRYRTHPSIALWCARNEGPPPKELDEALMALMTKLDPQRLYQSSSTDGRGVSSGGPYYWRSPRFFYQINEAFKTETGSVSIPTLESIQGMMPEKDWETIDDDWAQHDMASGAQRGHEYPFTLAARYGPIRNLADFVRKGQLANYEAYRAMYEGRNQHMFTQTTGIFTWMSHPAQPSFVWQLYHHDLESNSSLYAVQKAAEPIHVQLDESDRDVTVVNNTATDLHDLTVRQTSYRFDGTKDNQNDYPVALLKASTAERAYTISTDSRISEVYFLKFDLLDASGKLLSTNFYWQNVAQDDFSSLMKLPVATVTVQATSRTAGDKTVLDVTVANTTLNVALMTHLQLHRKDTGKRVLPAIYSDNYMSLVPGERRSLTIEASTAELGAEPLLLVDGFNVGVQQSGGTVPVALNENAQPMHWPASSLVPQKPGAPLRMP